MEKVIVYCESHGAGRRFYPERAGQQVGYRLASDFQKPENADVVMYQKDYEDIKLAYTKKKKKKK